MAARELPRSAPDAPSLGLKRTNRPNGPTAYILGNGLGEAITYDGMGRLNGKWLCKGGAVALLQQRDAAVRHVSQLEREPDDRQLRYRAKLLPGLRVRRVQPAYLAERGTGRRALRMCMTATATAGSKT